jgi:hypothetical protein
VLRTRVAVGVAMIVGVVLLAACGSSSSSSASKSGGSDSSSAASSSAGIKQAQAVVAKLSKPQPAIVVKSLPRRPPTAETIDITTCALTVCEATTNSAVQAAKALGWHVKYLVTAPTPQAYVQSWNQMLQQPPKLIANTQIFPNTLIAKQLAKAQSLGIKIVEMGAGGLPTPPGVPSVAGSAQFYASAQLMGDIIAADAKGPAEVLVPMDPIFATEWKPLMAGLTSTLKATCGCTVATTQVSVEASQGQIASSIISFLQRTPSVKYVAAFTPGYLVGLPQALAAAGLQSRVKLVGREPQLSDLQYLKAGQELGQAYSENAAAGWRAIDALARQTVGVKPALNVSGYHAILTPQNTHSTAVPTVPGVPPVYLKAWHLQ